MQVGLWYELIFNTLGTLLTMLPPGTTLALKWGGVSWAVRIFHENARPVGSTTLPREWT